jgi:flagellar FliL protein
MVDERDFKAAEKGAEPKKKSKLGLLLVLGTVVLLLAGGFYAYTTLLAPKPQAGGEISGVKPKQLTEAVGEMFTLEPFVVNLSDPQGKRYLKVTVSMELESKGAVERATKLVPKLRDMVIILLTSLTFEEVMTPEGKVQMRDELLARFNQILRPDRVRNIYFTDFVVQ